MFAAGRGNSLAPVTTPTLSPSRGIEALLGRYDPEAIDVPQGRARVRLQSGDEAWDAVIRGEAVRLERAAPALEPDALLSADPETWERIARDVRGGMDAFRRRRLRVRRHLHLGVGFLAPTSGMTGPERLRVRSLRTPVGRISTLQAGR